MTRNTNEEKDKKLLRQLIISELADAGWEVRHSNIASPKINDKERMRQLHRPQRIERAFQEKEIVKKYGAQLLNEFADGCAIKPKEFSPKLIQVQADSWENYIFRFATLLWSIPVSRGYGRRIRYIVKDESNNKLVGIFALGDPVFNLKMRDDYIGWDSNQRKKRLYNVMDAYVLGSVPPYNRLLGGKFIALATISEEVREDFGNKYRGIETIIERERKEASLVLVTTTSALGKSSIYNRLQLGTEANNRIFYSVGFSGGWGHFHISDSTFFQLREWLRSKGERYADDHSFGRGPNWRMRTMRRAFELLDFDTDLLRHGLRREIFLAPTAKNFKEYLRGDHSRPRYYENRGLLKLSDYFKERWMIPRSERINDWKAITRHNIWEMIMQNFDILD